MANVIVGVKGLIFTLDPQVSVAGNISTLTGSTSSLVIRNPDGVTKTTYAAVVAGDGKTATYTTVGTEFATVGRYTLQFVVAISGNTYYSPEQPLTVSTRL